MGDVLPQEEMCCGSGMTSCCWRRLKEWHEEVGVWERLHEKLLDHLLDRLLGQPADRID